MSASCRRPATVTALIFATVIAVLPSGGGAAADMTAWKAHIRNLEVLFPLELMLNHARKGALVEYAGDCEGDFHPILFPALHLESPRTTGADLATIQQMFRNEKMVSVGEDADGVISIKIGDAPDSLLQQMINELAFRPIEQYSQQLALEALINAPDVKKAARAVGIAPVNQLTDIMASGPLPGLPHLPRRLNNLTIERALHRVATTFGGIVLYGFCRSKRLYSLDFLGGYNMDETPPNHDFPQPVEITGGASVKP